MIFCHDVRTLAPRADMGVTIWSHPGRALTNLEGIFVGHNRILSKKKTARNPGQFKPAFANEEV